MALYLNVFLPLLPVFSFFFIQALTLDTVKL